MINNLLQFHAAMAALAPIDGVDANGTIFFQASATPAQRTAATAAAAAYTDVPPQLIGITVILGRLTDAEYNAVIALAQTNTALHRVIYEGRQIDLSLPAVQALMQAIATAAGMTAARQAAVSAVPPPPTAAPVAALPPLVSLFSPGVPPP